MAKDTISQYSKTAGSNTDIQSVSIAEGMAPSDVNNAIRELMVDLASLYDGTQSLATLKATTALSAADGSTAVPSVQFTSDTNTGLYWPGADTVGVVAGGTEQFRFGSNPIPGGSKNMLINGAMRISQRGSTAIASAAGPTYSAVDRFLVNNDTGAQVFTTTQDSTVLAGSGFSNSLKLDVTTADASVAAGDLCTIEQRIEAQNLQHLLWGNAAAKTITLSFDFRSPKSGTHCVAIYVDDGARHYIREFTVAGADTFEHFEVTFPGDTGGTINDDTGIGMRIVWPLICGSTYQNAADTWASGADFATSNQQNLVDNTSNNIYLSGVQIEVGSVGTDFAHEDYGTTLSKCQRYFIQHTSVAATGNDNSLMTAKATSTTQALGAMQHMGMRATPSLTVSGATDFKVGIPGAAVATTAMAVTWDSPDISTVSATVASGLTAGQAVDIKFDGGGVRTFALSAEL